MATPPTADTFAALLRAEGLTVVEVGRWQNHNRNHKGPWGPVHGVMIHHTVTKGTDATVRICRDGYTALPGPLCHVVIDKQGTIHLVGYGRANHAGLGDSDVLQAVITETPALPRDDEADTDGNRHFYGFECENLGDGQDPWPTVQLEAIEKATAAICRYHGWGPRSVIGHLEWQPGKVDPRGFTMDAMRDQIADRLADPVPTPPADAKPPAKPAAKPVVDLSKLVAAAKADPPRRGTPISYYGVKVVEQALVAEGLLSRALADGHFGWATRTAYASWQRRCGYKGADADSIPGRSSLSKLGARRGFTVTA
ncbi:N-acetylmuramoyl-L-alanine amidase [Streptomyces sp. ISL-98]|uniref:N-acetylmuramoyl-L-alanine amidase n=1 Tax=Streptomyces sp. ISL-98 TaxID=2819192 RepID=UPI001BE748D0|nr:N-acetylmuramoyl-L-alanine amidase [Streptomyces sp. ISL-98]MBT2505166.1 N-acetylmuramoyl-L-alanine amidase [Streptomyces sp. ISL-98]